ncbi:FSR family fosmidomycin resistance protein-like MFS transporter [Cryobacterium mesophilum]|uniref:MFS transporter n=1 Tax=Terrimesophilobacter mesophilus TaxID=433647 RepID=A0A4R8VBS1_9MICO|nr:MFS transporter [Terrimesophilobacter mesophilus]MBB5633560.1 FSR family fosmidomycin resistance protein-like MFS transporter [Terrimesophilobacter mesophilus]TFB80263.1 MFS transporter [Terrimesophilobacter mesophilus]
MATSHLIDDFYQGVVPALLPFLVLERQYSYAAVAGLTLAANLLSSVAQPAFGWWGDRTPRRWLIPAGMVTAAIGVSLVAFTPEYWMTWLVIALSGIGISAFHPEAARAARIAAGNSNRAMSVFAVGGNLGFATGSLVATPLLLFTGLGGTPYLLIPAAVMAVVIVLRLQRVLDGPRDAPKPVQHPPGPDNWPGFLRLTAVVVVRSIVFFGSVSFIALYFIHDFRTSQALGGAALTVFLTFGAVGTLFGGWLADRVGRLVSIRIGFAVSIPSLLGLVLAPTWPIALVFVAVFGIAIFVPFAVFVILGQDYLPNRIGIASGVTVGLAVTVGGLFSPLLGWIADQTNLRVSFFILIGLTVLSLGLAFLLREPASGPRHPRPLGDTTAEAADEGAL